MQHVCALESLACTFDAMQTTKDNKIRIQEAHNTRAAIIQDK